jgi:hypothetical protein
VRIKDVEWAPSFSSEYDGANWLEVVPGIEQDASGRLEGKMGRYPKHMQCHARLAHQKEKGRKRYLKCKLLLRMRSKKQEAKTVE